MKTTALHSSAPLSQQVASTRSYPWLMLISRSVLFILFQLLVALVLAPGGTPSAWNESARWWTFMAFLTNFVSVYLLVRVFKVERKRYDVPAVCTLRRVDD